jgi:hypothetical protein
MKLLAAARRLSLVRQPTCFFRWRLRPIAELVRVDAQHVLYLVGFQCLQLGWQFRHQECFVPVKPQGRSSLACSGVEVDRLRHVAQICTDTQRCVVNVKRPKALQRQPKAAFAERMQLGEAGNLRYLVKMLDEPSGSGLKVRALPSEVVTLSTPF